MASKDVLIPGICAYVTVNSNGDLNVLDGIKAKNELSLKYRSYPELSSVIQYKHKVLKCGRGRQKKRLG